MLAPLTSALLLLTNGSAAALGFLFMNKDAE